MLATHPFTTGLLFHKYTLYLHMRVIFGLEDLYRLHRGDYRAGIHKDSGRSRTHSFSVDDCRRRLVTSSTAATLTLLRQPVDGHLRHAVIMDKGCDDDEHVEYLMGLEPNVALSRHETLGDASGVEHRSGDVKRSHDERPVHGRLQHRVGEAVDDDMVKAWKRMDQ